MTWGFFWLLPLPSSGLWPQTGFLHDWQALPAAWAVKYIPFWGRPPFLPAEQIFLPLGWLVPLKVKESEVAQSCLTLCDPRDCSPPGSSVHGIFQARVLEWVAISFSRGSSQLRDWTLVSCIAGRHFTIWATREVLKFHLSCALALTIMMDKESHLTNPGGTSGKEPNCQGRRHNRHRFYPWVRKSPWRRWWQPTPVSLPGKSLGQRSLLGYSPWGHK